MVVLGIHCFRQMARPRKPDRINDRAALAVRLHDISASVAVGIALLKARSESPASAAPAAGDPALDAFELALASLRNLAIGSGRAPASTDDLAGGLRAEAKRLGIELDLEVVGEEGWLSDGEAELIRLAGREALRNAHRHSGSRRCHVLLDLADCPYFLRVRDWGGGILLGNGSGDGIERLRTLAQNLGAQLVLRSLPEFGTEFLVVGRGCPHTHGTGPVEARLRSIGAEEAPSRRRTGATRRPNRAVGEQITKT